MSESELAFSANGDNFEIPASVTGWRVRRMKPRGAPELVYGRDGRPLVLPIEADMDDLREAVGQLGRYRLDPVNEDGKVLESVPAAYIQVVKAERVNETPASSKQDDGDSIVKEAMRLNTELARSVIDRFPEMMHAAAELLRAADGAGLPAREPRAIADDDDEDDTDAVPAAPGFDLSGLLAQVVPALLMSIGSGKIKVPDIASALDWRKATPEAKALSSASKVSHRPDGPGDVAPPAKAKTEESVADALPPIGPQTMAHFIAIQSALKPEEAAVARQVASELAPAELRAWFDELSKLTVPQAVQKIRTLIAGNAEAVP